MTTPSDLDRYRPWFYAAAAYNLLWGTVHVLFPSLYFDLVGIPQPGYPALWQCIGMFVLVYGPAYWWAARGPTPSTRRPHSPWTRAMS